MIKHLKDLGATEVITESASTKLEEDAEIFKVS